MAVELITGHSGSAHVSGADVGALLAGVGGSGSYVLGEPPSVTMIDANTLSISPCELLLQGRHVRLTGTNTLSVHSGSQSGMRADLACVRYSRATDGTGTESASLVMVEGKTGTDAADPALPNPSSVLDGAGTADVAVCRVTLDALTPTATWLLPRLLPLALMYDETPDEADLPALPCLVVTRSGGVWLATPDAR